MGRKTNSSKDVVWFGIVGVVVIVAVVVAISLYI